MSHSTLWTKLTRRLEHLARPWRPSALGRTLERSWLLTTRLPAPWNQPARRWARIRGCPLESGGRCPIDCPEEYIQWTLLRRGVFEPEVTAALMAFARPGGLMLDVGANLGIQGLTAALAGMRVHAFEPLPRMVERLRDTIRLNHLEERILVIPQAAAHQTGSAAFYVAERLDDGSHSLVAGIPARRIEQIQVQTIRLDDHRQREPDDFSKSSHLLIKIDVEGAESLVLDGASNLLDEFRPTLVIETGDRGADQLGESARSVLDRLFRRDYVVFLLDPLHLVPVPIDPASVRSHVANYAALPRESPHRDAFATLRLDQVAPPSSTPTG